MKYVSLDLETTGLNPDTCQPLGISLVVEDTENIKPLKELPHFTCFIDHKNFHGEAYALMMNSWIFQSIAHPANAAYPVLSPLEAWCQSIEFVRKHFPGRAVLAGKNVGVFDYQFLPTELRNCFIHRIIDVGSVMIDWSRDKPMSLDQLKHSHEMGSVSHDMYEDALDVISLLRTTYP